MITVLFHGISSMIDNADGAIIQSAKISAKTEETTLKGMVSGVTQIVRSFIHSPTNEFSVNGHGDLTLVPQTTTTVANSHFSAAFITGGKITIREFNYEQTVGEASKWDYSGTHYPSAT